MENSFSLEELFSGIPPDNIFILTEERNYSYNDCITHKNNYRSILRKQNFTTPYIAVTGENTPDTIFLLMALWEQGLIPVMINARLNPLEMKEIILRSGCCHIFRTTGIGYLNSGIKETVFPLAVNEYADDDKININYEASAVILFTSGSSGKPKGLEHTFRALSESAAVQDKFLQQESGDKWAASLPFYHIGGFSIIIRSLFSKTALVIPSSFRIEDLCSAVIKFHPQYFSLVGTQLKKMLDMNFNIGDMIKNILIGGGFTDEKLIVDALERGWKISKVYGSTETIAFIAAINYKDLKYHPSSSGKEIIPGSIFILDENKNILSAGQEGEIAVLNLPYMKKYLNDEQETSKKQYGNYFLTGDIGYLDDEGYLYINIRRSDLIISGGENINPKDIETAIREIRGVEDVYVFGETDLKWGQTVSAAVVTKAMHSAEDIKTNLKGTLASFKVPKKIYILPSLPRNEIGKLKVEELKKIIGTLK